MEPYGLLPLTDLLNHPYLVRNRLAEALYGETGVAAYTRLTSRARGRHRFREDEVTGLLTLLTRLAAKLDRRAAKLAAPEPEGRPPTGVLRRLDLPELNAKPLIETALGKDRYYAFYDRARNRGHLPADWRAAVAAELHRFAALIRSNCEAARKEARQYPFSVGKGRGSHLG